MKIFPISKLKSQKNMCLWQEIQAFNFGIDLSHANLKSQFLKVVSCIYLHGQLMLFFYKELANLKLQISNKNILIYTIFYFYNKLATLKTQISKVVYTSTRYSCIYLNNSLSQANLKSQISKNILT